MKFSISKSILIAITMPLAALGCRSTQSGSAVTGGSFASPNAAFEALASAARHGSMQEVESVLGIDATLMVEEEHEDEFLEEADTFLELYDSAHHVENPDSTHAVLLVGETDWPFPIPVVQKGRAWSFDVEAGREEILARRIGENELSAIQVVRAIGDAQDEYRAEAGKYATHIASSDGAHDGLYWFTTDEEPQSPIGVLVAEAAVEGSRMPETGDVAPYMGYYFRMLEVDEDEDDGTTGYAVLAWPADYGTSGIMSFAMDERGVLLETDLGERTMTNCCTTHRYYAPNDEWAICTD